ncbi:unnamed protein product [Cylicostephanus goldi]|uniref:Uncharacterized protein n=1 Tax=Cylicostephanus goldi TaxID=71465 RepID=A0A3P6TH99_CYLGO|nr:unnamed protein product [Cylicostephanus goldi]
MDPIEHWVDSRIKGPAIFHGNLISMHHLGPEEIRLIDGLLYGVAAGIWNRSAARVEETINRPPEPEKT